MKRKTDDIRYFILKTLDEKGRTNVEYVRLIIKTGLHTVLNNAEVLEKLGFVRIYETNFGKRKYKELEITNDGKEFLAKLKAVAKMVR